MLTSYRWSIWALLRISDINSIRDVILDKKRRAYKALFEIILKPSKDATYGNTVRLLDEMTIDAVHHFALVDISQDEYNFVLAMK